MILLVLFLIINDFDYFFLFNSLKCKIISPELNDIQIDRRNVEKVQEFTFLGSVVPGTSSDVSRRIGFASSAFGRLKPKLWSNRNIILSLKVRIYRSLIIPIAIYASEIWTLRTEAERRLLTFEMRCLRNILGVSLRDRYRNEQIRQLLKIDKTIVDTIRKKTLQRFGHLNRLHETSLRKEGLQTRI